jgi:hypothetical protein
LLRVVETLYFCGLPWNLASASMSSITFTQN